MKLSKPLPGRQLGWTDDELSRFPYAKHWNPSMQPLASDVQMAVLRGPVAEPLIPALQPFIEQLNDDAPGLENAFTLTHDGAIQIAVRTVLPGVTPPMVDWWFGWHSDSPERYKLWHPRAHVHATWRENPPVGSQGRKRYVGQTSLVDEYVGADLGRFAIGFIAPEQLGITQPEILGGVRATAICARVGLAEYPLAMGTLLHHVRVIDGGSEMRSRFWIGGPNAGAQNGSLVGRLVVPLVKKVLKPSEAEARALMVHCAEEMSHLATFLPTLYRESAMPD